jgi:hypothetical protein
MMDRAVLPLALFCGIASLTVPSTFAQTVSDYAIRLSGAVQTNPPQINLTWPPDSRATGYWVYRKARDDTNWDGGTTLPVNATGFADTNLVVGATREYGIYKTASSYYGDGFLFGGVQVPLTETRGKVILLIDSTFSTNLASEIARLQQDLIGDGWTVVRHDVPRMAVDPANTSSSVWSARSNELATVKSLIKGDYSSDPANVKSVFLLGHVPVPYSGNLAPDGHSDHVGAWPADAFYADMDGTWTDSTVTSTGVSDQRTRNVPGDGKFDQTEFPATLKLQIGRVDFANMPAFPQSELSLLRQYLNKDHNFRHGITVVERRGLVSDNLGTLNGEVPAANGWRNFATFFGASNTFAGPWLSTLSSQSYLWGYACGGGTYTSEAGVANSSQFITNDTRVVFTMHFGSYFGDWDSQNNLMRAQLATTNYALTCVWASRPNWLFHHMALGETIGFSTRLTQNNYDLYDGNIFVHNVHIALMGDPSLRMHPVAPVSGLVAFTNGSSGVDLSWNASTDTVVGYHVYRAATAAGPFTRLTGSLLTGTNYTDPLISSNVYMVRAVKLEVTGSGSYYNASQGIFQNLNGDFGLPILTISAQSTNKIYGAPLPGFVPLYSGFTNGDSAASLSSPPVLNTPATASSPSGNYPIHVSGAVSSNYIIRFVDGVLAVLPAGTTGQLSTSSNPALPTQPVSFSLTLNAVAPGAGSPTGAVQFKIDGTNAGSAITLTNGSATYSISNLSHGFHTVEADYNGDGNFRATTNTLIPDELINSLPLAGADTVMRDPNATLEIPIPLLLANDSDPDGDLVSFVAMDPLSAHGGTVVSNANSILYNPPSGFTNSDSFFYSISDGLGAPVTALVTINIRQDSGPPPSLWIANFGNNSFSLNGSGASNRTYRIESVDDLSGTNWQTLGSTTADGAGNFRYTNSPAGEMRFYRAVYP